MTEPYHKKPLPLENLPNSIRYILQSLQDYKESVHKITLNSQSPQVVNLLKAKLSDVGTEILRIVNNSNTQTVYPDLEELFDSIRPQIRVLSSRDRIILTRWVEQMFFQNPYTVDLNHIQNLADTWYEPTQNSKENLDQKQNDVTEEADEEV